MAADDQQLVKACLRGNPRAQRQLYEQHKLPLFRLCLRYARDHQEAEDFLHDAFLVIFRDLGQFRGTGPLGGWMRRLTINVALQQLRKQRRLLFPETDLEQAADIAAVEEDLPPLHDLAQVIAHIQALPAGYRAVFNLFVVEGFSHQHIADQLGISVGASKSQLSKAKAMLRGILKSKTAVS
ncbi:MAG: RNA polymerase subunit sigma-70 [Bacteroidetes bacterium]|nr:MAG: RNA polymerase subunit sigma-70 [Bacteroidota bacterium]PTM14774.1 MAG: RNA polymerase subunit sigma-70 [Bacteroidota bacterium]